MRTNRAKKLLKKIYGWLFRAQSGSQGKTGILTAQVLALRAAKRGQALTFNYDRELNEELTRGLLRNRM